MTIIEALEKEFGTDIKTAIVKAERLGIFEHFLSDDEWSYLYPVMANEYYLNRSGKKQISPIYETYIENIDSINYSVSELLASIIQGKFGRKWSRVYDDIEREITQVNMSYKEEIISEYDENKSLQYGKETNSTTKTSTNTTTTDTAKIAGFNSADYVDSNENTTTIVGEGDNNKTESNTANSGTDNTTKNYDLKETKQGFDRPQQELVSMDIDMLNKYHFFDIIYSDIDSVLTLKVY